MAEQEPEQVEEPVELVGRVAAIDVAKDSGMVCIRLPHPGQGQAADAEGVVGAGEVQPR